MEKNTREYLKVTQQDTEWITRLNISPRQNEYSDTFYDYFSLKGIRVDTLQPGSIACSFTVPSRLTDRNGDLAVGAIANIVDAIGGAMAYENDAPMKFSVDMSISYLSKAKLNDEMEISAKLIGGKGGYAGTLVVLKNKLTGEIIAEGRHSLFCNPASKL
uniref:uncharacterized protein LOC122606574 n=1 Tax=Erigeron canadensis TaxID=72917 RepID=UPI001CB9960B|nr:uncharacterized protein LOC122606574 [Erigeron canadensis]